MCAALAPEVDRLPGLTAGGLLRVGPESAGVESRASMLWARRHTTDSHRCCLSARLSQSGVFSWWPHAARCRGCMPCGKYDRRYGSARQPTQTAQAILTIASEAMVQAIQEITVNEGVDPREALGGRRWWRRRIKHGRDRARTWLSTITSAAHRWSTQCLRSAVLRHRS